MQTQKSTSVADDVAIEDGDQNCCDKIFACSCCVALEKTGSHMVHFMERCFYKLGVAIGKYPILFMVSVILMVGAMLPGLIIPGLFFQETDPLNLWTPYGILARDHKKWVDTYYKSFVKFESFIIEADDILTPAVLQEMVQLDQRVKAIRGSDYSWRSLCAKLGDRCWSNSLLELWSFNETVINSLSRQDILDTVNNAAVSPVYFNEYDVEEVLGLITYSNGEIVSARATTMTYFLNATYGSDVPEDDPVLLWELDFLEIGENGHNEGELYYFSSRSFSDEGGGAIGDDVGALSTGYIILIVFVFLVIGRFNLVQQRAYVTLSGICCIGFSIVFAMGLMAYIGVAWGPLHSILPFLLLGIGVDDMFVIVQCYDQLGAEAAALPIHEKIGLTMKHAGMSILVTSITDICAFAVGSSTILPALRSFCIYSAVGIGANFCFQATFFVACVTMDQRRVEMGRNACCCCYVHRDYTPNSCSQRSFMDTFFRKYFATFVTYLPVQIVIFVGALAMFGLNIWATTQLEQDFDYRWFIPSDSYATEYFEAGDKFFPDDGLPATVYLGSVDYYGKHEELLGIVTRVLDDPYTSVSSIDVWYKAFIEWVDENSARSDVNLLIDANANNYPSSEDNYYTLLNMYMYGEDGQGARFIQLLRFEDDRIVASRFDVPRPEQPDSTSEIVAMDSIREVCDDAELGGAQCFVYAERFLGYEGNRVIQAELYRNLLLAFVCVLVMTLVLLANLWACCIVCLCVAMCLVNVGGFMYFWGLTIDTVTTINLLIAIGLTVDYSAHVAHTFMTKVGTRTTRVQKTLSYIGPAVFYGGFSTFLAFILLASSTSYVFKTFFKVFFLVVLVGLFHGLLFLPVVLSWVGPPPYQNATHFSTRDSPRVGDFPGSAYKEQEMAENGAMAKPTPLDNPAFTTPRVTPPYENDTEASIRDSPRVDNGAVAKPNPLDNPAFTTPEEDVK